MRVLFSAAFRPFFLAAAAWPALVLPVWLAIYAGRLAPPRPWLGSVWHAHEMLFGYAIAAVAGFLLTAVPKWTSAKPLAHGKLAALFALWLLGRIAMCSTTLLPASAVALVDCAFVPALALWVAWAVLKARSRHNYGFVLLLATVCAGNLLMHAGALGIATGTGFLGERLALYAVLAMLLVIAGRIVPGFTESVLRRKGIEAEVRASRPVERATLVSFVLAVSADLLHLAASLRGAAWLVLALCIAARMLRWRTRSVLHEPILWILHVGQLWLIVGCGLSALSAWSAAWPELAAQHAFTAGAVGTTVLGVMTRAALGHSGRALGTGPAIVSAYLLVIGGGVIRVLAPLLPMHFYLQAVNVAGGVWVLGYAIFGIVYWPILTKPEIDEAAARGKRVLTTL